LDAPNQDRRSRSGLLRTRDFRLIFVAYGTTHLGDDLAIVALTLRVYELTADTPELAGLLVSALLLAELLPRLLFAPLGGLLVDRFETVRLLAVASILQAGLALGLAFVRDIPALLALSFLLGTVASVSNPAIFALVPVAAGEDRVSEANARLEVARYAGGAVGPLLAGVRPEGAGAAGHLRGPGTVRGVRGHRQRCGGLLRPERAAGR
jgi:MFS family permease